MNDNYKKKILEKVTKTGKNPLPYKRLLRACKVPKGEFEAFTDTLEGLKDKGVIIEQRDGFLMPKFCGVVKAKISRLNKTFAFAENVETQEEIFIPGRFLKGAMPEDIVSVKVFSGRTGDSLEGEVVSILKQGFSRFIGVITLLDGELRVIPDNLTKYALEIENPTEYDIKEGDKVLALISYRGNRHSEHVAKILANFGTSLKASVCAKSILELNEVKTEFDPATLEEAVAVSDYDTITREAPNRLDLRDLPIFTIDGADTKDIDDAISLSKDEKGYFLGVHIADVSFYVKPKSALDNEAMERGTSVYYANRVVPMLPRELSNGICSLNPLEDRLAFSALMHISYEGELVDFEFKKTIIRSRVKGVYSEINKILAGESTPEIDEKYKEVKSEIGKMCELADILERNKIKRGVPQLESSESKLIINDDDICVGVKPRSTGRSEAIIEDFMLLANESAAKLAQENGLPFVYRVHENPGLEKIKQLEEMLNALGVQMMPHQTIKAKHLADVIRKVKGTDLEIVVNNLVLRSMAKAKYSNEPLGHFGLVLKDYSHFTSPIRRYPDLSIHRIMSDYLAGAKPGELNKRYQKFVYASSQNSSDAELKAMRVERDCEDCYKAEYMSQHIGEEFDGVISSVMNSGFFVELPDTCEGYVAIESLNQGDFIFDGSLKLSNSVTGVCYTIGDKVRIKVVKAEISSGKVDFEIA